MLTANGTPPDVIGSSAKKYPARMARVIAGVLKADFSQYDEVFVGFAPQLVLPLFAHKFGKYRKNGGKVTIDFFISVYDTLVNDRRKIKDGTWLARMAHRIDERTINAADKVIADTKTHGQYFTDEFGLSADKLTVLYLEADKTIYYPREVVKPPEYKGRRVVLYFASMLPLQGLEIVNEATWHMRRRRDTLFVIIGPSRERYISENVIYIEWLSQEKLAEAIAGADLCLAGHFNASIAKASRTIPGKAFIYRAMNKPMILGDNPANRELFDETQPGIGFCKMGDSLSLAKEIERMLA